MEQIAFAYKALFTGCLPVLAGCLLVSMIRSARGPEICDRILSVNMIGTVVSAGILILGALLDEAWLFDITLIYVLISFLAVAILAAVYIKRKKEEKK